MEYTIFNPEYLVNITGGDKATMEEIAGIFGSQIPEFVSEMKQLLGQGKYLELGTSGSQGQGIGDGDGYGGDFKDAQGVRTTHKIRRTEGEI